MSRFWIGLIISVPIIPKVAVFQVGGTGVLLDDFVLLCGIALGFIELLGDAIACGQSSFFLSRVSIASVLFFSYKAVALFSLSLFYPWGDLSQRGLALLFVEGIIVLVRLGALAAIYLLAFHFLRRIKDLYFVFKAYGITVLIVVAIGLIQYFLLDHGILTSTFRNIDALGQVIPGVWGVENPWLDPSATGHEHLGAFMVFALSVISGCLSHGWPTRSIYKKSVMVLFLIGVFVLMMASSRGAWFGALCAGIAFIWLAFRLRKLLFVSRMVLLLAGGVFCLYVAGFDFAVHIGSRVDKLPAIFEGKVLDNSGIHRMGLLNFLWNMFMDKPLLGWGAGGAGRIAEGQYIRELVEGGIIGGFLFFILMVTCGKMAMNTYRTTEDPLFKGVSLGFVCGLVGLMGHCVFTELFILPKVSVPFWVIAAVLHRFYFIESQCRDK
jgi:O-antigen ligase